jgi:hypothetical protein
VLPRVALLWLMDIFMSKSNLAVLVVKLFFAGIFAIALFLVNPGLFRAANFAAPSSLVIPDLNLKAPFEPLGLNLSGSIEVPKNNWGVGWFVYGAEPGEIGPFVVVGHLDSSQGDAVFAHLNKIKPGNKIMVQNADDSLVTYSVTYVAEFSQNNFPTQAVYGPLPYAGIRLITCSGTWDKKAGHYTNNLIVFGSKLN